MSGRSVSLVHIVDGDPAVRDSLTTLLDLNGFKVRTYPTGEAFLKKVLERGSHQGAEWVVCEADLPDGSGIELFSKIRAARSPAPFILLVSRRNPSIMQSAREAGIDQVFQKPLVHRNLIEYIGSRSH